MNFQLKSNSNYLYSNPVHELYIALKSMSSMMCRGGEHAFQGALSRETMC